MAENQEEDVENSRRKFGKLELAAQSAFFLGWVAGGAYLLNKGLNLKPRDFALIFPFALVSYCVILDCSEKVIHYCFNRIRALHQD